MGRDARVFLAASGIHAIVIFGIYVVLLNLYFLRLGYGPEFIGIVQGTGILAIGVLSVPAGAAGRRWGLRRVIIGGLFGGSASLVALALSDMAPESIRVPWIVALNLGATSAMTLYYVNHGPYQMSISTEADRTYQFSLRWAFVSLGAFAGSMLAGFLPGFFGAFAGVGPDSPAAFRLSLLTASLLLLIAPLAMLTARPSPEALPHAQRTRPEPAPLRLFAAIAVVVLLWTASIGAGRTFFNLYLNSALGVSTPQIGLLVAAGQLMSVPAALLLPVLIRRVGRGNAAGLGFLGSALTMLPLALIPNWGAAGAAFMILSVFAAIIEPAFSMFSLTLVSDSWRPAMSGVATTFSAASFGLIALAGGYVIAGFGYEILFLAAGGISAIGVVLFWLLFLRGSQFAAAS